MTYAITQGSGINFSSTTDNASEHHSNHVMEYVDGAGKPVKTSATTPFPIVDQAINTGGTLPFNSITLSNTAVNISTGPAKLFMADFYNPNPSTDAYVKFYNKDAASVNPASDTPYMGPYIIPANGSQTIRAVKGFQFTTKISARIVTGIANNDNTPVSGSAIICNGEYIQ